MPVEPCPRSESSEHTPSTLSAVLPRTGDPPAEKARVPPDRFAARLRGYSRRLAGRTTDTAVVTLEIAFSVVLRGTSLSERNRDYDTPTPPCPLFRGREAGGGETKTRFRREAGAYSAEVAPMGLSGATSFAEHSNFPIRCFPSLGLLACRIVSFPYAHCSVPQPHKLDYGLTRATVT